MTHQDDLWRDVLGRAADGLHLALLHFLCQPKIRHLDTGNVVLIRRPLQQQVLQLQVPVCDLTAGSTAQYKQRVSNLRRNIVTL